jgi:DNA mismatch repair ATPase MutL
LYLNIDFRFNSKREFKIGQNYTANNAFWVQPKMPPNIAIKNFSGLITSALQKECKFTKSVMANIHVVSQVDRKFISCITQEDEKRYLLLIDQHAAHERVCLERLMQSRVLTGLENLAIRATFYI